MGIVHSQQWNEINSEGASIYFVLINEEFVIRVISYFSGSFCHSASQRRSTNLAFLKGFSKKPNLQHV